jgi:hypothetical protein
MHGSGWAKLVEDANCNTLMRVDGRDEITEQAVTCSHTILAVQRCPCVQNQFCQILKNQYVCDVSYRYTRLMQIYPTSPAKLRVDGKYVSRHLSDIV